MILYLKLYIHRLDGGNFNCYNLYKWGGVLKKTRLLKIVLKRTGAIKLLCSYVIVFFAVSVAIWIFEQMIIARRHAMARNPWVGVDVSLRRQKVISGG